MDFLGNIPGTKLASHDNINSFAFSCLLPILLILLHPKFLYSFQMLDRSQELLLKKNKNYMESKIFQNKTYRRLL